MSKRNINDLPSEILTEIFRFLNGRNLKNATLTCKLWNCLIESGCRWSWKVSYYEKTLQQKMNFILTTNRKFGTIEIENGHLSEDNQFHKLFQRHGLNIVKLVLDGCCIGNLIAFAELLNLTPNLKHAHMEFMKLVDVGDVPLDQILPDLNKLKNLKIFWGDEGIIQCFRKAKITTMEIFDEQWEPIEPLLDFLSSQERLTSFIDNTSSSILAEMGKLNFPIPFRLTKLRILSSPNQSPFHDSDNYLRFLKSQAETLSKIEIAQGLPNSVYECVFASMTKLKTLKVLIDEIPRDNEFYKRLKENCSVRTLKLGERFIVESTDMQFLGNFLKKLPNIRSVYINSDDENTFVAVAQNLSKLESLSIGLTDCIRSIGRLKFANLKTLRIENLTDQINWEEFADNYPLLTELNIEMIGDISCLTSDDIDQIMTNVPTLQKLRLGRRSIHLNYPDTVYKLEG